jgi:hypothetical protein
MAGRRKGSKRRSTKRHSRRRGGNWFQDLGAKLKNEFTNPQSMLRQSDGLLDKASSSFGTVPGLGKALSYAQKANSYAKQMGFGRRRKSRSTKRRSTKRK